MKEGERMREGKKKEGKRQREEKKKEGKRERARGSGIEGRKRGRWHANNHREEQAGNMHRQGRERDVQVDPQFT